MRRETRLYFFRASRCYIIVVIDLTVENDKFHFTAHFSPLRTFLPLLFGNISD